MVDIIYEFRNNVLNYLKNNQYGSAIFWAELLIKRNEDSLSDLYLYLKALHLNGEYRRVIDFIERYQLTQKYLTFRLLAARCYFAIKDSINAIQVFEHQTSNSQTTKSFMSSMLVSNLDCNVDYDNEESVLFGESLKELENNCYLLLGDIYNHMENRDTAAEYYKMALKTDVKCYQALQKLYSGNMMTADDAKRFLASLDYSECENEKSAVVLKAIYEDLFNIECEFGKEANGGLKMVKILESHHQTMLNSAVRFYHNSRFKKAYELTKKILKDDPHNPHCITLHAAVLTELKYSNELFSFASTLIENYSDKKESWYAIGCYYLSINKYSLARLQFLKATELDKFFGFAWLAVGHTYSMDNERDQALAAYCSASQAIKGSHLPILYIALEYSLSNNTSVSVSYMQEALKLGDHDPYCWHEKGFISFNNKNYQDALKFNLKAYDSHRKDNNAITGFWEPLLNNIAHCYYKLGDYDNSLNFFKLALGKKPRNPSTMSSMALVYTRKGDISKAMTLLQRVTELDRDNNFARSLISTLTNINCKYSDKILIEESSIGKDSFKIPSKITANISAEKNNSQKHFETLRRILSMDAEKILPEDKDMDTY